MSWTAEANIKGPKGDKGDKGDPGATGAPGTPGTPGAPGTSVLPATATPLVEAGTGAVGVSDKYAREDHVHPLGPGGGGGASVTISVSPPASPTAGNLWWESDTGILYIYYNDGTSSQWVMAVPSMTAASIGAVTYTAQSATPAQATVARQNVYAAPLDALAYSGMQINGSMDVNQEAPGNVTTHAKYIIDGWRLLKVTAGITGLSSGSGVEGFNAHTAIVVNTPIVSLAAGDLAGVQVVIEGYRVMRLAWGKASAQPITLGFWVAHHRVGQYSVAIGNSAGNRAIVGVYAQNAADTWEYKTITFAGDTTGTWLIDNGIGMTVSFGMAVGSTYVAPAANTWYGVNYLAVPGQVNAVGTTSDVFRIAGLVVLPGIEAPSASRSPLIMRPYDQELLTCRRYWQCSDPLYPKGQVAGMWQGNTLASGTALYGAWNWSPVMRTYPTATFWSNGVQNQVRNDFSGAYSAFAAPTFGILTVNHALNVFATATLTTQTPYSFNVQLDARL